MPPAEAVREIVHKHRSNDPAQAKSKIGVTHGLAASPLKPLGDLPGVELITAPTAEIGIELIRAHLPDVVIMDVNLPGMSGIEAVQRLREIPETRDIPVIGLSAAALLNDTSRAKQVGFYRYLTKPVKVAELISVLEELFVRRS